jgi:hypothetical protein
MYAAVATPDLASFVGILEWNNLGNAFRRGNRFLPRLGLFERVCPMIVVTPVAYTAVRYTVYVVE